VEASWDGEAKPVLEVTSRFSTRDRAVDPSSPGKVAPLSAAEHALYLRPTRYIPTDGIVKATSDQITSGSTTDLEKVHAIYDWVVDHTYRDPATRGCGQGDIAAMLKTGAMGGKCADINGLFVGLVRAAGIPARDIYGIRVAASRFGYKSLGANTETVTKAQHCRAEVYLSGVGWFPVDPADVRKVALEEPPGHLDMTSDKVTAARKTLFGAWETNWMAYNHGQDVRLTQAKAGPVPFLMYPQGEIDGAACDCLDADKFRYTITAREIV
jgi:transglutaminase-like putative cysteine protease